VEVDFSGKWEVNFEGPERSKQAIGLFNQKGKNVEGTFLTPTGDYRFLAGNVDGRSMKLSTFDGSHAYLFEAEMLEDGTISGEFWSGKSWNQTWKAVKNPAFELPDPYALTDLSDIEGEVSFTFADENGKNISLADARFENKVVLIQILGSWCPNCMDETKFLVDWYDRNKNRGVEIIGLAFERKADPEYAQARIRKLREKLNVNYPVLIAGTTEKSSVKEAMPWLKTLKSYPTTIYLDRKHKVRKIYTGFSGPGTGEYYDHFVNEFNVSMDHLLSENELR
jgi:peroxiredoxin